MWIRPRELVPWQVSTNTCPSSSVITDANAIRGIVRLDQVPKTVPDRAFMSVILIGAADGRPVNSIR